MPITTSDFSSLTDDLQEVYNEAAKVAIAESVGMTVFDVKPTDRRTYDYLVIHGLDVIKSVAQGADLPVASSDQGDSVTVTQARYGGIVSITKDMRMFDLKDEIMSLVKNAAQDAFDKVDWSLADVLSNGWSSSYTDVYGDTVASTAPDSQVLFYASHSNGVSTSSATFSNIITLASSSTVNTPLSRQAIVDVRAAAKTYKDPEGMMRPINLDTVLVNPNKYDLAMREVYSTMLPGTPNNDINPIKGLVTVKEWPRLATTSSGTSRANYWYMYDSKKVGNSLKALFAEKPSMDPPEQVYKNKNWEYSIDFYYAILRGYPNAIFGSTALSV